MLILDIGDELFRELAEPDDVSIASISFWLKSNLGNLNTSIATDFVVGVTGLTIVDRNDSNIQMLAEESNIYKLMYVLYWTTKQIRRYLGASATEVVLEVQSDGSSVRMVNKTTLAAEYRKLANDQQEVLDDLVTSYLAGKSLPIQVSGDDTISATGLNYPTWSFPRVRWY